MIISEILLLGMMEVLKAFFSFSWKCLLCRMRDASLQLLVSFGHAGQKPCIYMHLHSRGNKQFCIDTINVLCQVKWLLNVTLQIDSVEM